MVSIINLFYFCLTLILPEEEDGVLCPVLPSVVCVHVPYNRLWLQPKNRLGTSNVLCTRVFSSLVISIYVLVMGIVKCEKVFGGFLFFLVCFRSK